MQNSRVGGSGERDGQEDCTTKLTLRCEMCEVRCAIQIQEFRDSLCGWEYLLSMR